MRTALLCFTLFAPAFLFAQQPTKSQAAGAISPARQELVTGFNSVAGRCLALAKAVPEDKLSWRPMEGVRSFGEVFVHMAGSTLLFCSYAGLKTPAGPAHDLAAVYMKRGFELPEIFAVEAGIKSKDKIVEIMDQAFHQPTDLIRGMADSDLEKPIQFFQQSITQRRLLVLMSEHLSEHLGQAIAYARTNQIVPPWSRKPE